MRRFIRSPLTWMVVVELVIVGTLLVVAWNLVGSSLRTAVGSPVEAAPQATGDDSSPLPDIPGLVGQPGRGRVDADVAARFEVAFDVAGDLQVTLDLQASLQDVARAEADDIGAAVLCAGRRNRGLFSLSHGILHYVMRVDSVFSELAS